MHVAVIGAGTGGATFAGTLAVTGRHEVTLIEAGPDYGPFDAHRWPSELLDSRRIPLSHDWGLVNADLSGRRYKVERARVMGGCSAHNGCAAVRGLRSDFIAWAEAAGVFWEPDAILADFEAVERALRVRPVPPDETTPFQQAVHAASLAIGLPVSENINDIDEGPGVSICPVNKHGGVRWNAAFAFVDPVRDRMSVVPNLRVGELILEKGRVAGVRGTCAGEPWEGRFDAVVLAAGAYGSPELLLRSGLGGALPGIGRNLQDHPCAVLEYRASEALLERTKRFEQAQLAFDEAIIVKARSPYARSIVDVHIFASGGRLPAGGWYWQLWVGLLTPLSRGRVRLDADGALAIEHDQLSDAAGTDLAALRWGVELARDIAAQAPLAALLTETAPGPECRGEVLDEWIRRTHVNYYHPAGTCTMGPDPDTGAVVDGRGRVHGVPGLMVADASIMPVITAGNTNVPTAALAHRLARHFDDHAT